MSDSDDTDFLLFIPPNFFNISSPECFSPLDRSAYLEVDLGTCSSIRLPIHSLGNMENKSPFLNRINGKPPLYSREQNDAPSSMNALDLSPFREDLRKTNMCNTWPAKNNEVSTAWNTAKTSDLSYVNNKLTGSIQSSPSKIDNRSSKFSVSQVDQLLLEMEKTRAEIKNKLQSNKSKIFELRRESHNTVNQTQDSMKSRTETLPTSDPAKSLSRDIFREKEVNAAVENSNQLPKNQLNFDVNFAIPG